MRSRRGVGRRLRVRIRHRLQLSQGLSIGSIRWWHEGHSRSLRPSSARLAVNRRLKVTCPHSGQRRTNGGIMSVLPHSSVVVRSVRLHRVTVVRCARHRPSRGVHCSPRYVTADRHVSSSGRFDSSRRLLQDRSDVDSTPTVGADESKRYHVSNEGEENRENGVADEQASDHVRSRGERDVRTGDARHWPEEERSEPETRYVDAPLRRAHESEDLFRAPVTGSAPNVGVLPSDSLLVHRSGRCRRRQSEATSSSHVGTQHYYETAVRSDGVVGINRPSAFGRVVSRNAHHPRNPDRGDRHRHRLFDGGTAPREPGTCRIPKYLI